VRICERNNSTDTKISEEGGREREIAPRAGAEIPLQPVVKTWVREVVSLQTWRSRVEQTSNLQSTRAGGCAERGWVTTGSLTAIPIPHLPVLLWGRR